MNNPTVTTIIQASGNDFITADGMVLDFANRQPSEGTKEPYIGAQVPYEIQGERVLWATVERDIPEVPANTELSVLIEIHDLLGHIYRQLLDVETAVQNSNR